jgi:CRISPR-associated protein Cas1
MISGNVFPLLSVQSLHALLYCERLFYLEEVERIRLADASVYAGRRLHVEIEREEDGDWQSLDLQSERLGLRGRVDCLRRRDGSFLPYEHKRGRAMRNNLGANEQNEKPTAQYCAWPSDRVQVVAYAMLLEETTGHVIKEARVRYHQDNITVKVPIDDDSRAEVVQALGRARALAVSVERPPVTENERLCIKCSLAPACLPEEARRSAELVDIASAKNDSPAQAEYNPKNPTLDPAPPPGHADDPRRKPVLRLFPADDKRRSLHVVTAGARIGRSGDEIEVSAPEEPKQRYPVREVAQVVIHGFAQITTQALRLCAEKDITVHWVSQGGSYMGAFSAGAGGVQRRIRQYEALRNDTFCLELARRLAEARILSQLRFLLRATRDRDRQETGVIPAIEGIRRLMPALRRARTADEIRGVEGRAGALYFEALPTLIDDEHFKPEGRSRRPPQDRFNALIGFGYALLLKDVMSAILVVGLDPAFGFYHRPRSQAHPLALDLIELFRVSIIDLSVIASINRRQWDAKEDFNVAGQRVWLSDSGRRKLIEIYERRKSNVWKHPALGYSLSYGRLIELEARLLEKEWSGEPGLFARMRLR